MRKHRSLVPVALLGVGALLASCASPSPYGKGSATDFCEVVNASGAGDLVEGLSAFELAVRDGEILCIAQLDGSDALPSGALSVQFDAETIPLVERHERILAYYYADPQNMTSAMFSDGENAATLSLTNESDGEVDHSEEAWVLTDYGTFRLINTVDTEPDFTDPALSKAIKKIANLLDAKALAEELNG